MKWNKFRIFHGDDTLLHRRGCSKWEKMHQVSQEEEYEERAIKKGKLFSSSDHPSYTRTAIKHTTSQMREKVQWTTKMGGQGRKEGKGNGKTARMRWFTTTGSMPNYNQQQQRR